MKYGLLCKPNQLSSALSTNHELIKFPFSKIFKNKSKIPRFWVFFDGDGPTSIDAGELFNRRRRVELCNDDGFIYKRRKETIAGESSNPPDSELDPAEEERNRKKRKRKILLNLKRKYQKEIDHWGILSNTLCAMQEKSNKLPEIVSSSIETRE